MAKRKVFLQWFYSCLTVFKRLLKSCFDGEKRFFQSFFTVKKKIGVSTVFPWWCFHRQNEKCLATVTSLNGKSFNGEKKSCLNGLEKKTCVNGVSKVFKRWEQELFRGEKSFFDCEKRAVSTVVSRWQKEIILPSKINGFMMLVMTPFSLPLEGLPVLRTVMTSHSSMRCLSLHVDWRKYHANISSEVFLHHPCSSLDLSWVLF